MCTNRIFSYFLGAMLLLYWQKQCPIALASQTNRNETSLANLHQHKAIIERVSDTGVLDLSEFTPTESERGGVILTTPIENPININDMTALLTAITIELVRPVDYLDDRLFNSISFPGDGPFLTQIPRWVENEYVKIGDQSVLSLKILHRALKTIEQHMSFIGTVHNGPKTIFSLNTRERVRPAPNSWGYYQQLVARQTQGQMKMYTDKWNEKNIKATMLAPIEGLMTLYRIQNDNAFLTTDPSFSLSMWDIATLLDHHILDGSPIETSIRPENISKLMQQGSNYIMLHIFGIEVGKKMSWQEFRYGLRGNPPWGMPQSHEYDLELKDYFDNHFKIDILSTRFPFCEGNDHLIKKISRTPNLHSLSILLSELNDPNGLRLRRRLFPELTQYISPQHHRHEKPKSLREHL